ncbi:MAG: sodium:proton antiporter [Prochlorococcaceae cyanobacterium]
MARLITVLLRLLIWLLLSADLSWINVLIGALVAMLLPMARSTRPLRLRQLLVALRESLLAIPQAYSEGLQLLWRGRDLEESLESQRFTGSDSALLIFLEVFRVTLTPFTIALGIDTGGRAFRVHRLAPRRGER